jgi:predicted permease
MGASFILSGHAEKGGWRRAINTPVVAILLSLVLNFAHVTQYLPVWVLGGFKMLGAAAIPMALLLLGATMSDFLAEARPSKSGAIAIAGACLVRMGLLPLAFIAMAHWLPCSQELRRVLVVQACMPSAMLPVVLSKHYGGDAGLAVQIVLATTVLALVTMPYWMSFGLRIIGY